MKGLRVYATAFAVCAVPMVGLASVSAIVSPAHTSVSIVVLPPPDPPIFVDPDPEPNPQPEPEPDPDPVTDPDINPCLEDPDGCPPEVTPDSPEVTPDPPVVTLDPPVVTLDPPTVTTGPPDVTPDPPEVTPFDPPTPPDVIVPPELAVELTPELSSGEVGSAFTWTATVTSDGDPVLGIPVEFLAEFADEDDVSATHLTGADGEATHMHTRPIPGLDELEVVAMDGEQEAADTAEREWEPVVVTEQPEDVVTELETIETEQASVPPGGDLALSGAGCAPDAPIDITMAGTSLGRTTADATGAFTGRFAVHDVALGQYVVAAQCGQVAGETRIDVAMTVSAGTGVAQAVTTAVVLTFFVLLGAGLVRGMSGHGIMPTGH